MRSLRKYGGNTYPEYSGDFLDTCVCNEAIADCFSNSCNECKDGKKLRRCVPLPDVDIRDDDVGVCYMQWESIIDSDNKKRLTKIEKTVDSVSELYHQLLSMLPKFINHCHTKRNQTKAAEYAKDAAKAHSSKVCIQIDFAENYTCLWQDEVQSAHWNKRQVTIFSSVSWSAIFCYQFSGLQLFLVSNRVQ